MATSHSIEHPQAVTGTTVVLEYIHSLGTRRRMAVTTVPFFVIICFLYGNLNVPFSRSPHETQLRTSSYTDACMRQPRDHFPAKVCIPSLVGQHSKQHILSHCRPDDRNAGSTLIQQETARTQMDNAAEAAHRSKGAGSCCL